MFRKSEDCADTVLKTNGYHFSTTIPQTLNRKKGAHSSSKYTRRYLWIALNTVIRITYICQCIADLELFVFTFTFIWNEFRVLYVTFSLFFKGHILRNKEAVLSHLTQKAGKKKLDLCTTSATLHIKKVTEFCSKERNYRKITKLYTWSLPRTIL